MTVMSLRGKVDSDDVVVSGRDVFWQTVAHTWGPVTGKA